MSIGPIPRHNCHAIGCITPVPPQMLPSMGRLFYAHAARVIFWLAVGLLLVGLYSGCTVDHAGLDLQPSPVLTRGASDAGVLSLPVIDSGISVAVDVQAPTAPDGGESGSTSTDGGTTSVMDGGIEVSPHDAVPPSECPISPTRSLTPCTATTAVCRYYDTGAPVLMSGCTAEGFLCVIHC